VYSSQLRACSSDRKRFMFIHLNGLLEASPPISELV
jgi:hypothetical protein